MGAVERRGLAVSPRRRGAGLADAELGVLVRAGRVRGPAATLARLAKVSAPRGVRTTKMWTLDLGPTLRRGYPASPCTRDLGTLRSGAGRRGGDVLRERFYQRVALARAREDFGERPGDQHLREVSGIDFRRAVHT